MTEPISEPGPNAPSAPTQSSWLWNEDLAPVPLEKRTWGTYNYAALWVAMSVNIPTYMLASALYRMTRPPLVVGGLAMAQGYFKSMLQGRPRYEDAAFRRFLREYQWASLLKGKRRATAELNARQASLWDPLP